MSCASREITEPCGGRSARWRRAAAGEEGSILPSLYLAQKRVDALADGAALAGADGFVFTTVGGEPTARLTDAAVAEQASTFLGALGSDAAIVSAGSPDGVSSRVTVAGVWHPPVVTLFVPDGVRLESTATSRTVLR